MDFSARLAGLKILARFENTGLGFSARAELRPGLNPSPCNRQLGFQRICLRSRAEISARDETHHVIGPLVRLLPNYSVDNELLWSHIQHRSEFVIFASSFTSVSANLFCRKTEFIKSLITHLLTFCGTTAKKLARTPCLFAISEIITCALSSRGVSRKYYITTATGNLRDE